MVVPTTDGPGWGLLTNNIAPGKFGTKPARGEYEEPGALAGYSARPLPAGHTAWGLLAYWLENPPGPVQAGYTAWGSTGGLQVPRLPQAGYFAWGLWAYRLGMPPGPFRLDTPPGAFWAYWLGAPPGPI